MILDAERRIEREVGLRTDTTTDAGPDLEDQEAIQKLSYERMIPEVRKCNMTQFKNRFGISEGLYAVDVLVSNAFLNEEIEEELKIRQNTPRSRDKDKSSSKPKARSKSPGTNNNRVDRAVHTAGSETRIISRIRIQSPAILAILSRIMEETWSNQPRTFFRDFCVLIYFQPKVREDLHRLEAKWGDSDDQYSTASTAESQDDAPRNKAGEVKDSVDDSPTALAELKCYVEFVDKEIMPLYEQFDNMDYSSNAKIQFSDLWYLFRTGELIYRASDSNMDNPGLSQLTWKSYGLRPRWARYRFTPVDYLKFVKDDTEEESEAFVLDCFYIDYTGDEYCVVTDQFKIRPYEGERLVTSFNFFPFRFVKDYKKVLAQFTENGKEFINKIATKHRAYNWWTLTRDPRGNPTVDADGNEIKRPEHVNSEVIVDFVQAFQTNPQWKPHRNIIKWEDPNASTSADDFLTCWWSDEKRTKLLTETTEIIMLNTGVCAYQRNKFIMQDDFLVRVRENNRTGNWTTARDLSEDDLPLLPARVFAYVLQDRKFMQLHAEKLMPVKESLEAFESLKIDPRHKTIVKTLVKAHFMQKAAERKDGVEIITQDLILGKGKGLFILLHGVPGVGKTATAEAVARANGKPLFAITCGDLGLTPSEVESSLRRIFQLANAWDCVLLLDEVDTFFSQRSKSDTTLAKNAMVSGALKVRRGYTRRKCS